ncbi:MAG: hypothetical protein KGP29_04860 [Proteobacteria bacterium]|nr:hypothetical protein [Pseudomonadota bacterium]
MKNNFGAIAIFLIGIIGVVFAYLVNDGLPGDLNDARFNMYVLEHFYLSLTGQTGGFLDASFFYPLSKVILFSDNHWGTGLIYSYFRFFDAEPIEAFSFWFLVGFILNYWSAFYVLRKLELSQLAAAMGAFLFTFALPVIAQDGHCQLIYRPFVPLAFLAFHYYTKSKNFYHLAVVALMVSLQFLISVYSGMFLVFFLIALAVVELFLVSPNKMKNLLPREFSWTRSIPILITAGLLLLLFAIPYFQVKNLYHLGRSFFEISLMLPRIQSYFLADRSNLWFADSAIFSQLPARWEHQMFIGIGAFLALLFLYLRKGLIEKKSLAQKYGYALLLMIFATLSVNGFTLYILPLLTIPGVSSLRSVSREILVMLFPISYLVAFSIDKIRQTNFVNLSSAAITSIICFLIIIDPIFADKSISPIKEWRERIENLRTKINQPIDQSSILVVLASKVTDEIDAMLLAQKLNIKTINGYSGNFPRPGWYLIDTCDKAKARLEDVEGIMQKTKQEFALDRSKIVAVGFSKKCDFTTSR